MSASSAIKKRLSDLNMSQIDLAETLGTTRQNLNNKLNRDNFTTKELSEICKILSVKIKLIDKDKREYIIEYPDQSK